MSITTAVAALALAVGCGTQPGTALPMSSPPPVSALSSSAQAPLAPADDEAQVRMALRSVQDAYNAGNWDAYLAGLCPAQRAQFVGPTLEMLKQTRAQAGPTTQDVLGVAVNGDTAVATVNATNATMSRQVDMRFTRGVEGWKLCMGV